ncbi:hypothetical protein TruAng_002411 [Truncatella angustata]|nr:hypothetical protein TruAng_002411 [Truncatella angustata]
MSEDVSRFLEQVRELGDRRAEEDEARSRELEEKILADRKERQARRAERARSISPQKSSPANTPPPANHRMIASASPRLKLDDSPVIDAATSPQTPSNPAHADAMATHTLYSESASKENESPYDAEDKGVGNPVSPARSATVRGLNWQRRPNSQASNGPRSRPLSMFAAENAARSSTTPSEPTSATETVSRDQIAQSLLSKDPSWFRQTADRGATSEAYRKNQVEDAERTDVSSGRAQLPGMGRRPSQNPSREVPSPVSDSPSLPELPRGLGSPLFLTNTQKLDAPNNDDSTEVDGIVERQPLMSPPLGLASPSRGDRPVSPTKGIGGFVQSAMMKRNDSVNKRWSVQSPGGLQRADSAVSNRSSYIASRGMTGQSRPTSRGREYSTDNISRPSSSQGKSEPQAEESISRETSDLSKPSPVPSQEAEPPNDEKTTPPTSPSKTMDSRRWSPTKASWLESALNKPESPKPKAAPQPTNQPAWLAEIAKAKAQKAANPGGELSRATTISHKHQVSIGGLARANAPGIGASPTIATHRTGGYRNSISEPSAPVIATHRTGPGRNTISTPSPVEKIETNTSQSVDRAGTSASVNTGKSKPETPPKKDFRANLKSRQPPAASDQGNTDFRNVIGSLRRTTIKNYVAPDELKHNILRGKAGLNLTGGPKKTERIDEFKEAILAKKKEFGTVQSEGRGVTRSSSTASEQPVPEGLVKRFEIARRKTVTQDTASFNTATGFYGKQEPTSRIAPVQGRRPSIGIQREPARGVATSKVADGPVPMPTSQKEANEPGRLQGKVSGSALANRFNPALAGLLARGPPIASGPPPNDTGSTTAQRTSSAPGDSNTEPGSGPKLTHMTKSRARGPKRKAPSSATTPAPVPSTSETPAVSTADKTEELRAIEPSSPVLGDKHANNPATISKPEDASPKELQREDYSWQPKPKPKPSALVDNPKPLAEPARDQTTKPPRPGRSHVRTKSRVFEQVAAFAAHSNPSSPTKQHESEQTGSQPPSPRKLDLRRMSKFGGDFSTEKSPDRETAQSVRAPSEELEPKPLFSRPETPRTPKPEVRSPPQLSSRPLPEPEQSRSPPSSMTSNSKRPSVPNEGFATFGGRALPTIPPQSSSTPAKPRPLSMMIQSTPRPLPTPGSMSPAPLASPMRSPTKQAAETTSVLNDFFGPSRPRRNYTVDAAQLLMQRPNVAAPTIQSLSAQLFQFSADGKKVPVAAHHDRVLFECEMYLCSHTFNNEDGKKVSEVYFWVGDEVPSSIVEDASIFVSREARALGGTLVGLSQNKETPEFIAALGGIVITRRGSSNKYDSLAPHMLCGRRYQGQIVFDEVDYTPVGLCSGFPYLITSSGKCYLWKGKGSGADELSCARLIGMDYALSGELEEIDDGREPAHFWSLFGGGSRLGSADHWRLKPNYDMYTSRLFRSDASSKQQKDLKKTGIYVLDAFFELYIIVGANAQAQYASFHNALEFAQEYAILVAGMEDRPFVPVSTVILEGIPKDMKSVFRKWRDADSPTIMNPSGGGTGLRRGRSLRVVPLNTALLALRD